MSRAGAAARKVVTRKSTEPPTPNAATKPAEKVPAKKAPTRKAAAKKAPAAKSPAANGVAKKSVATKAAKSAKSTTAPAKKPAAKKTTPAKKAATKSTAKQAAPAKKTTAKKTPTKSTSKQATPAKKAAAKSAAKQAVKKTGPVAPAPVKPTTTKAPSRGRGPSSLVVLEAEEPWTKEELAEVRGQLRGDIKRLTAELVLAEEDLAGMMRSSGEGAGNDQADVGSASFERDQEMTIALNARVMLEQSEHALERIADGSYGVCEECGQPIGKNRLMVFPRATLCMSCKQREERR